MTSLAGPPAYVGAAAIGVALHLGLFRHGEWVLASLDVLFSFAALNVATVAALLYVGEASNIWQACTTAATLLGCFYTGLYTSLLLYRGFFHRLGRFPGPFYMRFSNIFIQYRSAKNAHLNLEVRGLHEKYGDIVRVGPNELSINDPKAIQVLHSAQSHAIKGPAYAVGNPHNSLFHLRDKKEHTSRRKAWERGFSTKALHNYEERVLKYSDQLIAKLKQSQGKPIDAGLWFNFFSFDVMGDLSFGKSFNMLVDGVKHHFLTDLHTNMYFSTLFGKLTWLFPILKATPVLNGEIQKFMGWVGTQVEERIANEPEKPDVFSWILDDFKERSRSPQDYNNLIGDAQLIIIAGSDTTSALLTCLFYRLCLRPKVYESLREEIDSIADDSGTFDFAKLSKLKYLQAVIDEALRLYPPVPSGLQRLTPPEGMRIGEQFIPGNVCCIVPSYTNYRDSRFFSEPDEFIPERWTSRPELVKDASGFVPFSTGRYSCVGKQLALMEARNVIARIVREFDVQFAPDQNPKAFEDGLMDTFTMTLAPLNLVFTPRKGPIPAGGRLPN